jgi:D-arabinitol dehydrogenase (NADP+)
MGPKVTDFKLGDRVAADNSELCSHCFYCRRGEGLLCENVCPLPPNSQKPTQLHT